ncbi:hypothetical protein HNO88_000488 [Novosphingobium chloroacetimidivorans]|uniref:Uncharacterized protein n=1 Tax=Novosphingobium chloroacetimidivorans TaxID=1428314 RepID=A0A7W7NUG3_9SPHN|nr:hypothetical protein [Novosphingobium chloroacetimidivorans]MBB4857181.1 hypothetical protein [Novosphingobium chloroacetimidivorans]
MSGDPSRRPSNERVRVNVSLDAEVWIECTACLGDGWTLNGRFYQPRDARKLTCQRCKGHGAERVLAIHRHPNSRIIPGPTGWAATKSGS